MGYFSRFSSSETAQHYFQISLSAGRPHQPSHPHTPFDRRLALRLEKSSRAFRRPLGSIREADRTIPGKKAAFQTRDWLGRYPALLARRLVRGFGSSSTGWRPWGSALVRIRTKTNPRRKHGVG